jgi:hypothetical protein
LMDSVTIPTLRCVPATAELVGLGWILSLLVGMRAVWM